MSEPKRPSATGTVYVVPQSTCAGGDVAGCLLLDTGEVPWSHTSSSIWWLTHDLTSGFSDRREKLAARYPDGYEVVVVEKEGDVPAEVIERNKTWGEAEKGSSEVPS